ncbi:pyridoxamine 5'-phosphate oxidase family protein [Acidaminobacter sp. JC074]|uniref:pyridoxamine 5'-phosphate oxidase family protein n=1 Tax=Acidaminobacter sp. JC074 TaxID=2530199 RepID=UPI001F0D2C70|nr:pyridoxamine 5'-phosphate oxidase family protein [Acidaminobacter sp. JC074]MCH4887776.1 pyridoxamine 5'-phosphate oxidase family protein [Acidaminobacter sp. JC074]
MFREMRRKDKMLSNEECMRLLKETEVGVLSVLGDNGYPYTVPLNYVYKEGAIYFHSAKDGYKIDCIENDNKVSFCLIDHVELLASSFDTNYESVVVFGKVYEEIDNKKEALLLLIEKYSPDYLVKGQKYVEKSHGTTRVFRIDIDHMTGKAQQ